MIRREFSSQHPASSSSSSSSSSTAPSSTTPTSAATTTTASSGASSSPIHQRRNRRRTCRLAQRNTAAASCSSAPSCHRPCRASHAIKNASLLARNNPALAHKLRQMALPLSPLVQLTTGAVHPHFPTNVLQFWLLTDTQLESLAGFYHQITPAGAPGPSPWAAQYPCPVRWRSDATLEDKRRRMGRFIGLRGCESPVHAAAATTTAAAYRHAPPSLPRIKTEDEIADDARMARLTTADDEALRRKTAPGPWGR